MPAIFPQASTLPIRHARNPQAGIQGGGEWIPPEDCGNDELILSCKILAALDDSQT